MATKTRDPIQSMGRRIELLAPARNLESAKAAVDWGADALYMGAGKFGARHAAGNPVEDIALAVDYANLFGVRVYATLNTLVFENELREAEALARELIDAGISALIIQDMAYMEMGLHNVEMHASTQTFNASPEKVNFLGRAGFSRVILERGLTLGQIRKIRSATDVELECFVHGAICVGNSGRCWLSRSMGPRSGNRGECSQPCRQTYDLTDSSGNVIAGNKYLLSVKDLDLSGSIGDLIDAGVTSFKIEGRLKDLDYVKNTVGYYRKELDAEIAARPGLVRASSGESITDVVPDLSKTFTRGRSKYFFNGKSAGVASFDTNKAIGEPLGRIKSVGKEWFELDTAATAGNGDGICYFTASGLAGTNINCVEGRRIFPNSMAGIAAGKEVFRNYDHKFSSALAASRTKRVINTRAKVTVSRDILSLRLEDEDGNTAEATLSCKGAEPARDAAKTRETIQTQISKSGDTVFRVSSVDIDAWEDMDAMPFIPVSALNSLRREGLGLLLAKRTLTPPLKNIPEPEESYPYPEHILMGEDNVANSLAEKFYHRHGVESIVPALDLSASLNGQCVMRTPYCIRRETGQCLLKNPAVKGDLWLVRGSYRYRLEFDCDRCEMGLIKEKDKINQGL